MFRFFTKTIAFLLLIVFIGGCFQYTKPITIERVAVTGASVTAGYGLITPPIKCNFGGYPINLKHIVDAMILAPHEEVAYFGDSMFFAHPVVSGKEIIEKISAYDPTLIIAVDYLFWFAYGDVGLSGEEYRIKKFNEGLSCLENVKSDLLIGNIPDVHKAIGRVLSASHVPTVETIQKMNRMLNLWVLLHQNVTVLDVYTLYGALLDDAAIKTDTFTWPAGSKEKLLQSDLLHMTLEGTVAASLVVADAIGLEEIETNPKILMLKAAAIARAAAKK
jgi:hypothetical protein